MTAAPAIDPLSGLKRLAILDDQLHRLERERNAIAHERGELVYQLLLDIEAAPVADVLGISRTAVYKIRDRAKQHRAVPLREGTE